MKRKYRMMRTLALLSSGGLMFQGGLIGCNALSQGAIERYFQASGNAAIAAATAGVGDALGTDGEAIIVAPGRQFLQEIWSTYVDIRFPGDPVYDRLLVK